MIRLAKAHFDNFSANTGREPELQERFIFAMEHNYTQRVEQAASELENLRSQVSLIAPKNVRNYALKVQDGLDWTRIYILAGRDRDDTGRDLTKVDVNHESLIHAMRADLGEANLGEEPDNLFGPV